MVATIAKEHQKLLFNHYSFNMSSGKRLADKKISVKGEEMVELTISIPVTETALLTRQSSEIFLRP
jgi:hypothetical protein